MNKKQLILAVKAWCEANKLTGVSSVRHVHPRACVIGYAAPMCLVVSVPWVDSEPQCQEFDKAHPLKVINRFDPSLNAGDWCVAAYIVRDCGSEFIAIPVPASSSRE